MKKFCLVLMLLSFVVVSYGKTLLYTETLSFFGTDIQAGQKFYDDGTLVMSIGDTYTYKGNFVNNVKVSTFKVYYKGKLESESNYKDGKLDGVSKIYYENGKLKYEINWKDEKEDGVYKEYFENGKLKSELKYKDGHPNGKAKEYFEDGKLNNERNFKNGGQQVGVTKIYYKNGNLQYEHDQTPNTTMTDGVTKEYYANGKLKYEQTEKNGNLDGWKREYNENGQKIAVSYYVGGVRYDTKKQFEESIKEQ